MPYLAVLSGSWRYGREPGEMYSQGVHEITDEIAEKARAAGSPLKLVVTDEKPEIRQRARREHESGANALTLKDVREGTLKLTLVDGTEISVQTEPSHDEVLAVFACACGIDPFPTAAALARHRRFDHPEEA